MLEVNECSIGKAITETGRLLAERKHAIAPAVLRFTSASALRDFLATGTPPGPAGPAGDAGRSGADRDEPAGPGELTGRLALRQAAEAERRKYQRRGGDRLPGTRGGIFTEKITDAERVLAVILGLRKVCSWEVIAELFQVSRRTIGNATRMGPPAAGTGRMHHHPIRDAVPHRHRAPRRRRRQTDSAGHTRNGTLNLYGFSASGTAASRRRAAPRRSRPAGRGGSRR